MNIVGEKIKLAIGLGSTCSGCDIAILDINEKILDLVAIADIVFWPTAMDFKYEDIEKMAENEIDITLHHGTIRTEEHMHIAKLLREKSKVMIAFGSCSCFGGIPGLCNVTNREEIFQTVYKETASTINPNFTTPKTETQQNNHKLTLPELQNDGKALGQIVDVDYFVPGCPPAVELIVKLLEIVANFVNTGELPPKGATVASEKSVCDECELEKENKAISKIVRVHEIIPDPKKCLLEQGLICLGPATRGGCGTRCINALMPCRGCMGPTAEVTDQGAKMISAISSILGLDGEENLSEEEVQKMIDQIEDPLSTFYRFSLPTAMINKVTKEKGDE